MLASHIMREPATLLFLSNAHWHPASASCRSCALTAPLGNREEQWARKGWQLLQQSQTIPRRILVVTLCSFPVPGLLSGQPPHPARLLPVPSRIDARAEPPPPPVSPCHLGAGVQAVAQTTPQNRGSQAGRCEKFGTTCLVDQLRSTRTWGCKSDHETIYPTARDTRMSLSSLHAHTSKRLSMKII